MGMLLALRQNGARRKILGDAVVKVLRFSNCDCTISVAWEFSWAWRAFNRLRLAVAYAMLIAKPSTASTIITSTIVSPPCLASFFRFVKGILLLPCLIASRRR